MVTKMLLGGFLQGQFKCPPPNPPPSVSLHVYIKVPNFGICKILFLKKAAKFIWSKMLKKYSEIILFIRIVCYINEFIPVMAKLKFQQLLLQSSVSHDT